MMYVSVKYFNPSLRGYAGHEYTYKTELPLNPGDLVLAPTRYKPNTRAIVMDVELADPGFPCREIASYDTGDVRGTEPQEGGVSSGV